MMILVYHERISQIWSYFVEVHVDGIMTELVISSEAGLHSVFGVKYSVVSVPFSKGVQKRFDTGSSKQFSLCEN